MLKTGLVSITFRKRSPQEVIQLVTAAGLDAIEWGGDIHVPPGNVHHARKIARLTMDSGLSVAAYGSYYRLAQTDPSSFDLVLETAVEIGAPTIRVWAGSKNSNDASEEDWELVVKDSIRIADLAALAGLTISFEFHDLTLNDRGLASARLINMIRKENVLTLWQPPVGSSMPENLDELQMVLKWTGNLHVFHWDPGYTRLPLSEGESNWLQYIQLVKTTGRDHYLLLELVQDDLPESFLRDAQTLKLWQKKLEVGK